MSRVGEDEEPDWGGVEEARKERRISFGGIEMKPKQEIVLTEEQMIDRSNERVKRDSFWSGAIKDGLVVKPGPANAALEQAEARAKARKLLESRKPAEKSTTPTPTTPTTTSPPPPSPSTSSSVPAGDSVSPDKPVGEQKEEKKEETKKDGESEKKHERPSRTTKPPDRYIPNEKLRYQGKPSGYNTQVPGPDVEVPRTLREAQGI